MKVDDKIALYKNFMPASAQIPVDELVIRGFFGAPASLRFHGSFPGGLFDHSFTVAKALTELTEKLDLKWEKPDSPYIVGMYHDLCKCEEYIYTEQFDSWKYNEKLYIPDHGAKSVIMLQRYMKLTDEEIACIRWHMGAFETDTKMWEYYGRAIERFPNVLFTHTADMIASRIAGV